MKENPLIYQHEISGFLIPISSVVKVLAKLSCPMHLRQDHALISGGRQCCGRRLVTALCTRLGRGKDWKLQSWGIWTAAARPSHTHLLSHPPLNYYCAITPCWSIILSKNLWILLSRPLIIIVPYSRSSSFLRLLIINYWCWLQWTSIYILLSRASQPSLTSMVANGGNVDNVGPHPGVVALNRWLSCTVMFYVGIDYPPPKIPKASKQ